MPIWSGRRAASSHSRSPPFLISRPLWIDVLQTDGPEARPPPQRCTQSIGDERDILLMLVFAPKFGETEAKRRGYIMRPSVKSSIILRAAGAVAGLWLCGAGAAWAGGGADFGSLTALLTNSQGTGVCDVFHISPCPKPPSITQAALEVAALGNNLFEMLLLQNGFAPASRVKADNPVATAADIPSDSNGNAIFPTASTAPTLLSVLSNLRPLAFNSQSSG